MHGTGLYDPELTNDSGKEIVVLRVTVEGEVDTNYGSGGRAKLSYSAANTWTSSLQVLGDGSVFVSAWGRSNGNESFGSFLVNPSGVGMSTFGTNGFLSSPFPLDGALAVGNEVLVPKSAGLTRYGSDGAAKGTAIKAGVVQVKVGTDGAFTAVASNGTKFHLARYTKTGAADKTFAGPDISEDFADFVVLADGGVLYADGKGISWVGPKGGAPTIVAADVSAKRLALTTDGKLLVTSGDEITRYTL